MTGAREIEPLGETCRLTLTHRFSEPCKTFREVESGWNAILSSLKSLLETGEPLSIPERRAGRTGYRRPLRPIGPTHAEVFEELRRDWARQPRFDLAASAADLLS